MAKCLIYKDISASTTVYSCYSVNCMHSCYTLVIACILAGFGVRCKQIIVRMLTDVVLRIVFFHSPRFVVSFALARFFCTFVHFSLALCYNMCYNLITIQLHTKRM